MTALPKGRRTAAGPAWLEDRYWLDRAIARRWLSEQGPDRFARIVAAATAVRRPRHRPRTDYGPQERRAILAWITDPALDKVTAARITARAIFATGDWQGRTSLSETALRKRLRQGLVALTPAEANTLADELRARNVRTRFDPVLLSGAWVPKLLVKPALFPRLMARPPSARWTAPQRLLASVRTDYVEHVEKMVERMEPLRRAGLLAQALDGMIDPSTPLSALSQGLHDLAAALNERYRRS